MASVKQNRETLKGLQHYLSGTLILPQHADYDQARRIWNGRINKHPAAIACCATAQDVLHTVNFARDHGFPLSSKVWQKSRKLDHISQNRKSHLFSRQL